MHADRRRLARLRRVSFALVRLRVLGPLQLCDEKGRTVALRSPNQAVVLAVLVAHRGSVVSASTLIDALWGDDPPASAMATLRTYVSRLRGVVGPAIATRGDGWMFDVDVVPVDADEFEESVAQARARSRGCGRLWRCGGAARSPGTASWGRCAAKRLGSTADGEVVGDSWSRRCWPTATPKDAVDRRRGVRRRRAAR